MPNYYNLTQTFTQIWTKNIYPLTNESLEGQVLTVNMDSGYQEIFLTEFMGKRAEIG